MPNAQCPMFEVIIHNNGYLHQRTHTKGFLVRPALKVCEMGRSPLGATLLGWMWRANLITHKNRAQVPPSRGCHVTRHSRVLLLCI
ncbi:hypothetical protein RRG08_050323 [Elysia crispata]|uniref:Uncharacterized protein n=1 Tax=Elysia crispata TaxID=231223 RepID=A0AAE0ZYK8_9GAST|nr:hypothetical protein RRG08_050323 [Elysia crispata]